MRKRSLTAAWQGAANSVTVDPIPFKHHRPPSVHSMPKALQQAAELQSINAEEKLGCSFARKAGVQRWPRGQEESNPQTRAQRGLIIRVDDSKIADDLPATTHLTHPPCTASTAHIVSVNSRGIQQPDASSQGTHVETRCPEPEMFVLSGACRKQGPSAKNQRSEAQTLARP